MMLWDMWQAIAETWRRGTLLDTLVVATFCAVSVYMFFFYRPPASKYTEEEEMGDLGGFELVVLRDVQGKRMVGVYHDMPDNETRISTVLTSTQARLLAQLLRIAATKGKTVAEANREFLRQAKAKSRPA